MPDKIAVVGSNLEEARKSVERARELSLQARAKPDHVAWGGQGLLLYILQAGELVSPWWSRARDTDLDAFWKQSDHVSGALAMLTAKIVTVPVRAAPRDASVKAHTAQAEEFTVRLVEEAEFGESWLQCFSKWLLDFWASDNGGFFEVIGPGKSSKCLYYDLGTGYALVWDRKQRGRTAAERRGKGETAGPVVGPAEGLAHLDSSRCTRTGDPEWPVIYQDTDGSPFKYHATRVAFAADLPSPRVGMNAVGFCALSRCINNAQHLIDVGVYKQEKLGSRPKRAIIVAKRISTDVVTGAFADADEMMDNQGLRRFSKVPIIGDLESDADLSLLDLASLPDGFNDETSTRLGMFSLALAFGVPIRWIWPAAVTGATKADAMYQHIAGLGGGVGRVLRTLEVLLGGDPRGAWHSSGKFLPPHLKLEFSFQDDEKERMQSEIQKVRSETRVADLAAGVYTLRVAREKALADGDISRAQFEQMELADGRLPSGEDVLTAFFSGDPKLREMVDLGVPDPLDVARNDRAAVLAAIERRMSGARTALSAAPSAKSAALARQALAALSKLHESYGRAESGHVRAAEEERKPEGGASGEKGHPSDDGLAESAHRPERVSLPCPMPGCGGQKADRYADHGGLCVCVKCRATYDPEVEL